MRNIHRIGLKYKQIKQCKELMVKREEILKNTSTTTLLLNPNAVNYKMGKDSFVLSKLRGEITERAEDIAQNRCNCGMVTSVRWTITSDNYIEVRVVINAEGNRQTDFFILKEA